MFEGKPPRPQQARALGYDFPEGSALQELKWADLVSRLAAARDLRASLEVRRDGGQASFDAGSARRIAGHSDGEHAVNLDDSSNGKQARATLPAAAPGIQDAPRGNK